MKVLQVIPYFFPSFYFGGPVKVCYEISRKLKDRGHDVTVCTTDAFNATHRHQVANNREIDVDGLRVFYFRNVSNLVAVKFNGYLPLQFRKWISRNLMKYDLVHIHEFFTYQGIITSLYCRRYRIPYVLSAHGSLSPVSRKSKELAKRFFLFCFRSILDNASAILALTGKERNHITALDPLLEKKIRILPNGLRLSEFEKAERLNFRRKYNIPDGNKVILYLGRLEKIKGLDILIEAFALLCRDHQDLHLVLVGPDNGFERQAKRRVEECGISQQVIFTGGLYEKDKVSAYVDSDVYILPSYSEGLPMTVLEACALGKPVIITERCNLPEISEYQAGIIIKPEVNDIQKAILTLIDDPEKLQIMGENGQRLIKDKFTWDVIVPELEEIYREVRKAA